MSKYSEIKEKPFLSAPYAGAGWLDGGLAHRPAHLLCALFLSDDLSAPLKSLTMTADALAAAKAMAKKRLLAAGGSGRQSPDGVPVATTVALARFNQMSAVRPL